MWNDFLLKYNIYINCGMFHYHTCCLVNWTMRKNSFSSTKLRVLSIKWLTSGKVIWQRPHRIRSGNQDSSCLMQCYLGPQESPPPTGPRSVQPCLHIKATWRQIYRLTDAGSIDRNSPHLMHLMWSNYIFISIVFSPRDTSHPTNKINLKRGTRGMRIKFLVM